jgi:hypothetical protein
VELNNPSAINGCLVSRFDSPTPRVFVTTTQQIISGNGTEEPAPSIALEAGESPGSVLIGYNANGFGGELVQWNFEAYPGN